MKKFIICWFFFVALPFFTLLGQEGQKAPPADNLEEIIQATGPTKYIYDPKGRRDPFRSLLAPGKTVGEVSGGCENVTICHRIDELKLQGIFIIKEAPVAIFQGSDEKPYWLKEGDTLLDGEVSKITTDSVYFKQKVNDPTRIRPYREVVQTVNPEKKS